MGVASSTLCLPLATSTSITTFTCPANNNALYTSGSNTQYRLGCNTDFSGIDLGWSGGSGLFDCIKQCEAKSGCSAVVYAWNHACYFKGSDAQYKYSAGSQGAILESLTGGKLLGTQPPEPAKCIVPPSAPANPSAKSLTYLAMGDSITMGYLANECYNSYRLAMSNLLIGNTPLWNNNQRASPSAMYQAVHAVGSINSGNFTENASEGFDGGEIDTIRDNWLARKQDYTGIPNVATILAGIHDIADNPSDVTASLATQRMAALVDNLFQVYPQITVIVSTLTPVTVDGWKGAVAAFNMALPGLVQARASVGRKILMVDCGSALNLQNDIADFVHPNAQGYIKIAEVFYQGLQNAAARNWL